MLNRTTFYERIKTSLFGGALSQPQLDSLDAILNECEKQGVADNRQIAYILATAYWEAHNPRYPELRLTPIKEFGGEKYLRSKKYYPYFGRGFSQITWYDNYRKESKRLGLDLVNNPDLILDTNIAANSHVFCMRTGAYTGRKLSDYINEQGCDFKAARKIINGTDKAQEIAAIARQFLEAML